MSILQKKDILNLADEIIRIEVSALNAFKKNLDERIYMLCKKINEAKGKVIVIGVGKFGHIGN